MEEKPDIVEKEIVDEDIDMIDVPEGWKLGRSKCQRKFYYNNFNDEKVCHLQIKENLIMKKN